MHYINGLTCQPLLPCLLEALIRAGGPDHVTVIMTATTLLRGVLEEEQGMGGEGEEVVEGDGVECAEGKETEGSGGRTSGDCGNTSRGVDIPSAIAGSRCSGTCGPCQTSCGDAGGSTGVRPTAAPAAAATVRERDATKAAAAADPRHPCSAPAVAATAPASATAVSPSGTNEQRRWMRKQVTLGALVTLSKAVAGLSDEDMKQKGPAVIRQLTVLSVLVMVGTKLQEQAAGRVQEQQQQEQDQQRTEPVEQQEQRKQQQQGQKQRKQQQKGQEEQQEQQQREHEEQQELQEQQQKPMGYQCRKTKGSCSSREPHKNQHQQQTADRWRNQQQQQQGDDLGKWQEQQLNHVHSEQQLEELDGLPSELQQQQAILYVGARLLFIALRLITEQLVPKMMFEAIVREAWEQRGYVKDCHGSWVKSPASCAAAGGALGGASCCCSTAVAADAGCSSCSGNTPIGAAAAAASNGGHCLTASSPAAATAAAATCCDASDHSGCSHTCPFNRPEEGMLRVSCRDLYRAACEVMAELEKELLVSPLMGHGVAPTHMLATAAVAFYNHLTQMPPSVLQVLEKCLLDARWFDELLSGKRETIGVWQSDQGSLEECPWGPVEYLRLPTLLSSAILDALPVGFACNNLCCTCLDGPLEVGLVSHRVQVVCGGCGVARYCSRECQEEHWGQHKRVCKSLQKLVKV